MGLGIDVGDLLTDLLLPDPERRFRGAGKHPDIPDSPPIDEVHNRVFAGREPAAAICEVGTPAKPGARLEIEAVPTRTK